MSGVQTSGHWKAAGRMDFKILISNFWPLGEGFRGFGPQIRLQHAEISPGTNSEVIWLELKGVLGFADLLNILVSIFFLFSEVVEGPGGFKKLREACRNNFHLSLYRLDLMVPSYDQKPKKLMEKASNSTPWSINR